DHEPGRGGRLPIRARPGAAILFIVNPSSGGGKAGREWAGVESWLPSSGLPYEVAFTTRPFEATEMAQKAVLESRPVIVAVGGDGTLNEVVNGFFRNGAPIPTTSKLAMVPLGTGGDFRRTLRIPIDPKQAIEVLRSGMVRRLGGGMQMAPSASPTDGVFDVIVIKDAGKIETMRGINDFLNGKHLDNGNPKIELMYGKRITVTSPEPVRIDLDGEDVGFLPALFEIQPGAIEFITPR